MIAQNSEESSYSPRLLVRVALGVHLKVAKLFCCDMAVVINGMMVCVDQSSYRTNV